MQYFCLNCRQVPLITISQENSAYIDCECFCTNKWKIAFVDIFRINFIVSNLKLSEEKLDDPDSTFVLIYLSYI